MDIILQDSLEIEEKFVLTEGNLHGMLVFLREADERALNRIVTTIIQYELANQKQVIEILLEILQQEELTLRHHVNIYNVLQRVIEHIGNLPHKIYKAVTALAKRDISRTPVQKKVIGVSDQDWSYDLSLSASNLLVTLKCQHFNEAIHSLRRYLASLTLLHFVTFTAVVILLITNVFATVTYPVTLLVTIPCIFALTKSISKNQEVSTGLPIVTTADISIADKKENTGTA
uniref:Uncharacterized protein LOC117368307 n=1 Tax=Geotrypetes seraphini TaxID=260995 RepID=A0A6P8SGS8_GEOSA|nr:uncharacterized protein LOC117368307 [Geotrypetes seraphini]